MKLCMSHIAWPAGQETEFLGLLSQKGVVGLEIAPSRIWDEPVQASVRERQTYRDLVESHGLKIVALHALLYTRRDLGFFREKTVLERTGDYLKRLCVLAGDVGAKILVFGSPANRKRGEMPLDLAYEQAAALFSDVAEVAAGCNTCLCIEPLGHEETDFITSALDGLKLMNMVSSPGFGLHLDSKALSEESIGFERVMEQVVPHALHYHASEPDLAMTGSSGSVNHTAMGDILRRKGYKRFVSIEMRAQPDCKKAVEESLELVKANYLIYENGKTDD